MIINIPLSKAYELLKKAEAIIKDNGDIIKPELSELTGKKDNEFLYIGDWSFFNEGANLCPRIDTLTNELILIDDTNEEVRLSLLTTMKL